MTRDELLNLQRSRRKLTFLRGIFTTKSTKVQRMKSDAEHSMGKFVNSLRDLRDLRGENPSLSTAERLDWLAARDGPNLQRSRSKLTFLR